MGSESLVDSTTGIQHVALWLGRFLCLLCFISMYQWTQGDDTSEGYLGGLSYWSNTDNIFNWHPLMMTTGMVFVAGFAVTAFRLPFLTKEQNKILHNIFHVAAIICWSFGLAAIWRHKYDKQPDGTYIQSMYSFHAIVGLMTCTLYAFNYIIGLFVYALNLVEIETKIAIMPWHIFLGTFSFLMGFAAVLSGLNNFAGTCSVDPADLSTSGPNTNPAANWSDQSDGCHYLQSATICAYFAVALLFFGIQRTFNTNGAGTNPDKLLGL
jgi:hypothetical protein